MEKGGEKMEILKLRQLVQEELQKEGSADYTQFVLVPVGRKRLRLVEIMPIETKDMEFLPKKI